MRWQSFCHALSPPFSWLPLLFFYFKTRALFRPFHRFHLSVVVPVGAEVAMSRHFCFRIVHQQSADQYAERVALPFRACVFGIPIVVQSAFVGDSDRVGIVAAGVGAGPLDRACGQDLSVTADVEMIARAIKSTSAVRGFQSLPGKGTVLARGAAMYHNQVDFSHFFLLFAFGGCTLKGTTAVHGVCAECTQKCRSYSDDYFQNLVPG